MKKVLKLTESELITLIEKIISEQSVDLKVDRIGDNLKINNFEFQLQVKLPFGEYKPIKILGVNKNYSTSGYDIKVADPREEEKIVPIVMSINNDTIKSKILNNLDKNVILIPGVVADKKLIKVIK